MAKVGAVYPQVDARVVGLMHRRMIALPSDRRVAEALVAAQRAGADVVFLGARRAVRRRELERATRWGLGDLAAAELGWDGLPVVPEGAPESVARRRILEGVPMVLVRDGRQVIGVIEADTAEVARPTLSLGHQLERVESREGDAQLWALRVAGKVAERLGGNVFAVGGVVRDLLLGRAAPDVDLVVEGDGVAFARQLREEIGGTVTIHEAFCTASIAGAVGPGGAPLGRIDVASARCERYDAPGALPMVSAATVEQDLHRRDFSVNALAVALQPSSFGRLVDPLGGRLDLGKRWLRPLHPLSFVEDPTRIFRAARYAARLGFRLDATGTRALKLALAVGHYPALSGQRLHAELELMAAEPNGWKGLQWLLRWNALRLWDPRYESSGRSADRVKTAVRFHRRLAREGIEMDPGRVIVIALLIDQPRPVVMRCLARLAIRGAPARRIYEAATATPLSRRLDSARWRRPSDVADALRSSPVEVLAGAWLRGGSLARRRIEWFLREARAMRPVLSGDDVIALGVPEGPLVGQCLGAVRRARLDGLVKTTRHVHAFVERWLLEHVRGARLRTTAVRRRMATRGDARALAQTTRAAAARRAPTRKEA
jgi:tRNA nucleotidyltransferase (CCA-adding enzyme)